MSEEYINSNTMNPLFDQINDKDVKGKTTEKITELDELGEQTVVDTFSKNHLFQIYSTILAWPVKSSEKSSLIRLHLVLDASLL